MELGRRMSFTRSSSLLSIGGLSRKSTSSYTLLPQEPLKLSVLKLDGSCFDIEVRKSASVAELKEAVEAAFSEVSVEESGGQISWPHVWEQFCLCFDDQKLVAEIDSIRDFGIRDGDQLYFIRHHSPTYRLIERRSRKRVSASKQSRMSSSQTSSCGDSDENDKGDVNDKGDENDKEGENDKGDEYDREGEYDKEDEDYGDIQKNGHQYRAIPNEDISRHRESKLTHFLRGWFLGSRRRSVKTKCEVLAKTRSEVKVRPSRFRLSFWRRFGKSARF